MMDQQRICKYFLVERENVGNGDAGGKVILKWTLRGLKCIEVAQDRIQWRVLVVMAMKFRIVCQRHL